MCPHAVIPRNKGLACAFYAYKPQREPARVRMAEPPRHSPTPPTYIYIHAFIPPRYFSKFFSNFPRSPRFCVSYNYLKLSQRMFIVCGIYCNHVVISYLAYLLWCLWWTEFECFSLVFRVVWIYKCLCFSVFVVRVGEKVKKLTNDFLYFSLVAG